MNYLLRYYKRPDTANGAVLQKGILEFLVAILDKNIYKDFLKIYS